MKSLNSEHLKVVSSLYNSRPGFKLGLDRLIQDEVKSATDLTNMLKKVISASETETNKPSKKAVKKTGTGKRGRPPGSKNVPKAPKAESVVEGEVLDAVEAKMTHGNAILKVLEGKADGLSASEILEAISGAGFENYTAPSKGTLQTTLVGLREKKTIKTKGERPNTKYIAK